MRAKMSGARGAVTRRSIGYGPYRVVFLVFFGFFLKYIKTADKYKTESDRRGKIGNTID